MGGEVSLEVASGLVILWVTSSIPVIGGFFSAKVERPILEQGIYTGFPG